MGGRDVGGNGTGRSDSPETQEFFLLLNHCLDNESFGSSFSGLEILYVFIYSIFFIKGLLSQICVLYFSVYLFSI